MDMPLNNYFYTEDSSFYTERQIFALITSQLQVKIWTHNSSLTWNPCLLILNYH